MQCLLLGLRVIVSDDLCTYQHRLPGDYFFTQGAIASGEQMAMQTETDRDILAKSDAMSIDLHYCYHPVGAKWTVGTTNPTPCGTCHHWQLDEGVRNQEPWDRAGYRYFQLRLR